MTTNLQHLSLAQLFGDGAYQDTDVIVIEKASLLKLLPSVSNRAESLLVAILITALANFKGVITDENNQAITTETGETITFDNSEAFELIKMIEWQAFGFSRNNQPSINNQIIIEQYSKYVSD